MTARAEAARKGWATRRLHAQRLAERTAAVAAQHRDEAAGAWARMGPKARATAVARGFGAHLPAEHLDEIVDER